LLQWSGLSHSTYYYHPYCGKRGRKPSCHTLLTDGSVVSNESVVICIRFVLSEEFMLFTGYVKICKDLQSYGFRINKKKVYRLMKEHHLLCGIVIRNRGEKRQFVSYRVQQPVRPMEQLCMDIKYVYIHGEKRNALLLTVLDVYSRSILSQVLWWRLRKEQVIWLLHKMLQQHSTKGITLRNDNGSQFIAHAVREYLQEKTVTQEFTHVATPEENCFIEAYHSILDKQLLQTTEFQDIEEAIAVFSRWRTFYNERRRHGSLGQITPTKRWENYKKTNFERPGKADAGNAGEQPVRNNPVSGEEKREEPALASSSPPISSLFPSLQKPIENRLTVFRNLSSF
jgi:putative transposase